MKDFLYCMLNHKALKNQPRSANCSSIIAPPLIDFLANRERYCKMGGTCKQQMKI